MIKLLLTTGLVVNLLVTGASLLIAEEAFGHDAPQGWPYDTSCCSTYDCRPTHHTKFSITEIIEGYKVTRPNGQIEVVAHGDKRIRESKDEDYHVCTSAGSDTGRLLCIYVPFRGY